MRGHKFIMFLLLERFLSLNQWCSPDGKSLGIHCFHCVGPTNHASYHMEIVKVLQASTSNKPGSWQIPRNAEM